VPLSCLPSLRRGTRERHGTWKPGYPAATRHPDAAPSVAYRVALASISNRFHADGSVESEEQPVPREGSPYDQLLMAGYLDAWEERLGPRGHANDPGFTCCQDKSLLNSVSELDKRIDLIWTSPSEPLLGAHEVLAHTTVIGDDPRDRTPSGLWPSDHAGVASKVHVR